MGWSDLFGKKNKDGKLGAALNNLNNIGGLLTVGDEFLEACITRELSAIADDVLQPYIFDEDGQFDNVYTYELRGLYQKINTVKDILLYAMMGKNVIINKTSIVLNRIRRVVLFAGEPDELKNELKQLMPGFEIQILKSVYFEKIYSETDIRLLKLCYRALGHAYNRQERLNYLDAKMIFKVKGLHALFTQPQNHEEEDIAVANRNRLIENFKEILNGDAGIIDSEDNIGVVGGSSSGAADTFKMTLDMIFQEIARILRIPVTRLLGRAPQGMNATGESDALNYDMTMDAIRSGWLEPFLKIIEIDYKKADKIDIEYLKKVAEMYILLDIPVSEKIKERLLALGEDL